MHVTIRFFAGCREAAGTDEAAFSLPQNATLKHLQTSIADRYPALAAYVTQVRYSVNWEYVTGDAALSDGDEIAMIPPVAGGA
jgi:molybdopterin converting factor subunit 1